MTPEQIEYLKLGSGVAIGSAIAGKVSFISWPQAIWATLISSLLGVIFGMACVEYFHIKLDTWMSVAALCAASSLSYALIQAGITEAPHIIEAIRRKILGE